MFWFCKTGTIGITLSIVLLGLKMRPAWNIIVLCYLYTSLIKEKIKVDAIKILMIWPNPFNKTNLVFRWAKKMVHVEL